MDTYATDDRDATVRNARSMLFERVIVNHVRHWFIAIKTGMNRYLSYSSYQIEGITTSDVLKNRAVSSGYHFPLQFFRLLNLPDGSNVQQVSIHIQTRFLIQIILFPQKTAMHQQSLSDKSCSFPSHVSFSFR